jgi:hypothetical protein
MCPTVVSVGNIACPCPSPLTVFLGTALRPDWSLLGLGPSGSETERAPAGDQLYVVIRTNYVVNL